MGNGKNKAKAGKSTVPSPNPEKNASADTITEIVMTII